MALGTGTRGGYQTVTHSRMQLQKLCSSLWKSLIPLLLTPYTARSPLVLVRIRGQVSTSICLTSSPAPTIKPCQQVLLLLRFGSWCHGAQGTPAAPACSEPGCGCPAQHWLTLGSPVCGHRGAARRVSSEGALHRERRKLIVLISA